MSYKKKYIYSVYFLFSVCFLGCAPPDEESRPPATQQPLAKPKAWKWSTLIDDGSHMKGFSIDRRKSRLYVTTKAYRFPYIYGIKIRKVHIPSHKEDFPIRFFVGSGNGGLAEAPEICGTRICGQRSYNYVYGVNFDSKDNVYILNSTDEEVTGSSMPVRIIKFTKNVATNAAHPRELLAGGPFGNADGTGEDARFSSSIRNMALSTDETYIYVADRRNNSVRALEIQSKKVSTLRLTDAAGKPFGVSRPTGITVGTDNTVYVLRNSGGVGQIVAIAVPLPLPDDNTVRAREIPLTDAAGQPYQLRDNPVWYIAIDDSGALYSYTKRAGKRTIVKVRLNEAKTEGVVSELVDMKGTESRDPYQIRGLGVSDDGNNIYYADGDRLYTYTYE